MTRERLCETDEMKPGEVRRFDVGGVAIALVRIGDSFHAVGDRCSHANVSLSEGEVHAEEGTLECWKHGSTFDLTTGEPTCLPATKPVPVYAVRVEAGDVWVEVP